MEAKLKQSIYDHCQQHVVAGQHLLYGTAGFRGNAQTVEHLFVKLGLIAGLRALQTDAHIGIMITASHNPAPDNGVKLIDPEGEMLASEWESLVERFCNTSDSQSLVDQLNELVIKYQIDTTNLKTRQHNKATILIGMDTRDSSPKLAALLKSGIDAWSDCVSYVDYGMITTPALHYLVAESNKIQKISTGSSAALNLDAYYKQLSSGLVKIFSSVSTNKQRYSSSGLIVDCANGVGYVTMLNLTSRQDFNDCLQIELVNTGKTDGELNAMCGADYVKRTRKGPPSFLQNNGNTNIRFASLDGDADRVVYIYDSNQIKGCNNPRWELVDGDKIMALIVVFLKDQLDSCNLTGTLSLGAVQTAYANGASTSFMQQQLGVDCVHCVETGVKNLHKQALKYDIGVYFEANGHGTVWISEKARQLITCRTERYSKLNDFFEIVNRYTGDAISDILVVEAILNHYDWDMNMWNQLYTDRPSKLSTLLVPDRNVIETTNASKTCTKPVGLQEAIDKLISENGMNARCFVRPSGTENVVRIYTEAETQQLADNLSDQVAKCVDKYCRSVI